MQEFTHVDDQGRANMVDVGGKKPQLRRAVAKGMIFVSAKTLTMVRDNHVKKGDVLTVAQIAGIQAAKQTPSLIPLCHPLILDKVDIKLYLADKGIVAKSEVRCIGRTGVEMEALTAVSVALLTVYDMCKAVDKNMRIGEIELLEKVKENVE
jgi:cyclic pyranopterin monophosphate synthase